MLKSAIAAAALTLAFVTGASAIENNPWDLRDRMAYAVTMNGSMRSIDISDKGMTMLMRRAKKVPRGTVLFMNNGQLYMTNASSMFDSTGNAMFSGGR
jgi:hypothetical protein